MSDLARAAHRLNSLCSELRDVEACLRAVKLSDSWQHVRVLKSRAERLRSEIARLERRLK